MKDKKIMNTETEQEQQKNVNHESKMVDELKLQSEVEASEQKPISENSLENLSLELAEQKSQHLRLYAEFDNYKKRVHKERAELLKTAGSEMLISMLPVMDDFERALKSVEGMDEKNPMKEGIVLVYNKFKNILEQKGLKSMTSIGKPFDVDLHEAISNIPVNDLELKEKVVDEIEKGYTFNDKVIRHAKVVVGI